MSNPVLDEIRTAGHWRVNIRPTEFNENRIDSLAECSELIEGQAVRVSTRIGYPAIGAEGIINGDGWIESTFNLPGMHLEYWRYYLSGQFVQYFTYREDRFGAPGPAPGLSVHELSPSSLYLEILLALYSMTEIFEFSARMAMKEILFPSAEIKITLTQTENRQLYYLDGMRYMGPTYRCSTPEINLSYIISADELLADANNLALKATGDLLERFQMSPAPNSVLVEAQKKFLGRLD